MNSNEIPGSKPLIAIEICFFVGFAIQFLLAIRLRRIGTLLGVVFFAIAMEILGFGIKSHAHEQFRFQLFCFLPVKEVLWYVNSMFASFIIAENSGFKSWSIVVLLTGTLATLQDTPYEMINTIEGIDAIYVNDLDFRYGNLQQKLNGGSVMVLISFFLLSCSIAIVAFKLPDWANIVAIPVLGSLAMFLVHLPFHFMKSLGCFQFVRSERSFAAFQERCSQYSQMEDIPILFLGAVLVFYILLWAFTMQREGANPRLPLGVALLNAMISHGCFLYCLLIGSTKTANALWTTMVAFVGLCIFHLNLILLLLKTNKMVSSKVKGEWNAVL